MGCCFLAFRDFGSAVRDSFDGEIRCQGAAMSQPRHDRQDDLFLSLWRRSSTFAIR